MFKKIIDQLWSLRDHFIKYFIVGFSVVILDVGSLYLLNQYLGMRPVIAVVINQIFLLNYIFFLDKYWSFKSQGVTRKQAVRFLILAVINFLISIVWMWFFNEIIHINYLLTRIANVALAGAWNFFLYQYWVYNYTQVALPALKRA